MDSYLDIKMVPDDDIPIYFIRNKVYTKLHKALHTLQSNDIGVSFPNYRVKLGDVIRLHSTQTRLAELQATNWLGGLSGYCDISDILAVPENAKHRRVSRIHSSMTASKLRRLIKRGSINEEEIKNYKAKMFSKGLDNPYLELQSGSNGQLHRRYLVFSNIVDEGKVGDFDTFGLSKTATVPWF